MLLAPKVYVRAEEIVTDQTVIAPLQLVEYQAESIPLPIAPKKLVTTKTVNRTVACSCVLYAKQVTGYSKPVGYARNWPINNQVPIVGAVVITTESSGFNTGHVGVVTAVSETTINITEANYSRCKVTSRTISRSSKVIRGYYY